MPCPSAPLDAAPGRRDSVLPLAPRTSSSETERGCRVGSVQVTSSPRPWDVPPVGRPRLVPVRIRGGGDRPAVAGGGARFRLMLSGRPWKVNAPLTVSEVAVYPCLRSVDSVSKSGHVPVADTAASVFACGGTCLSSTRHVSATPLSRYAIALSSVGVTRDDGSSSRAGSGPRRVESGPSGPVLHRHVDSSPRTSNRRRFRSVRGMPGGRARRTGPGNAGTTILAGAS